MLLEERGERVGVRRDARKVMNEDEGRGIKRVESEWN